jgi:hypothetical protein
MRDGARAASAASTTRFSAAPGIILSLTEQPGEFVASLPHAVAAVSGQLILAANDHAQNGIAPIQPLAGLAFSPCHGQFSAQQNQATNRFSQIVLDLIGPIIERALESRDCRAAAIRTHWGTLPVKRK